MQFKDSPSSYGWVSIMLHWLTTGIVLTLWFIADSASILDTQQEQRQQISLHISIAASAYVFLWLRIGWRIKSRHPRLDNQSDLDHKVAKLAHSVLLLAIAVLLLTGPLVVWSDGYEIGVFGWIGIPGPFDRHPVLHEICASVHGYSGLTVIVVTLVHAAGALKHLMFNDDDVFLRIFTPK
ncbi:MAG TPA: cytochrome b [Gammaproteobacteria bacterium]|nr:cytochrome b [Gammaproteobacteria bacterium]HIK70372.1 cytochrome b [Pseudomonadales bacterium]